MIWMAWMLCGGVPLPGLTKRWIATADNRTRPSHLAAHMRYGENPIPIEEPFIVGGAELRYPCDPLGPPEESVNCRCRMASIVPEVGVLKSPLDGKIKAELEGRK